jgi:hypothetical protein
MATVKITVTTKQLVDAMHSDKFDGKSHREFVKYLFEGRGYYVTRFDELKFFYFPTFMIIEGDSNKSIISFK